MNIHCIITLQFSKEVFQEHSTYLGLIALDFFVEYVQNEHLSHEWRQIYISHDLC